MSRYTQLPTQTSEEEMEAAFDESDEEDETETSSRPLLAAHHQSDSLAHPLQADDDDEDHTHSRHHSPTHSIPGAYDFEYDYAMLPPPGSPPRPSSLALPNAYGNSNGLIPTASTSAPPNVPRRSLMSRALGAILPTHYSRDRHGGGLGNDGVFGNVVAKPGGAGPVRAADAEGPYWVPEETQKEAPPTYQSAQADSVPPYWENTILAPSGPLDGDMIIDGLPVGSVFAFLWNLLVSVSFQFVGFALTFLLHTTHASSFGSRAGLGITLIQYGFYMRSADNSLPVAGEDDSWSQGFFPPPSPPASVDGTASGSTTTTTTANVARFITRALPYLRSSAPTNATSLTDTDPTHPNSPLYPGGGPSSFTTSDWLSFLLMTIGWFLLITSLLGFWRVKRWERGVQASVQVTEREATPEEIIRDQQVMRNLEQAFGFEWPRGGRNEGAGGDGPRMIEEEVPLSREEGDGRVVRGRRFAFL